MNQENCLYATGWSELAYAKNIEVDTLKMSIVDLNPEIDFPRRCEYVNLEGSPFLDKDGYRIVALHPGDAKSLISSIYLESDFEFEQQMIPDKSTVWSTKAFLLATLFFSLIALVFLTLTHGVSVIGAFLIGGVFFLTYEDWYKIQNPILGFIIMCLIFSSCDYSRMEYKIYRNCRGYSTASIKFLTYEELETYIHLWSKDSCSTRVTTEDVRGKVVDIYNKTVE